MKKLFITLPILLLLATGCNFLKPNQDDDLAVVQHQTKAALGKPTLTLVEGDEPYIEVTWDTKVSGQFTVYRSTDPDKGWVKLVSKFPGSAHTALDYEYPKDAPVVYYRVTTFSAGQESEPSESASIQLTSSSDANVNNSASANWSVYTNTAHGFALKYPTGSIIEPATNAAQASSIRIQNYSSVDDRLFLDPGEYYLEISVSNGATSCTDGIEKAKQVAIGTAVGYRGLGADGGDAGGRRYALCFNKDNKRYFIQATENSSQAVIANAILDSFKFTK